MVNVRFRHSADIPNVGGRADTTAIARFNTGARQLHNALHNSECAHEIQSMSQRLSVGTFVSRRPHEHLADNFLFRRDLIAVSKSVVQIVTQEIDRFGLGYEQTEILQFVAKAVAKRLLQHFQNIRQSLLA